MKELEPIEVGNNMAKALLEWNKRDRVDGKDVATAVMHLLERYSIEREGSGEGFLKSIFVHLDNQMKERWKSF